ncbi:MAG: glycerophosphodiester phosphodiesterase family protein [Tissierella sp.]|uniref:glycerophosphodiester phosphodiesterase family protein n=1 Tax=Tissierella sp. TaxID=41274 RepID=UPI003F955772
MYSIYIISFLTLLFLMYLFSIKPNKKRDLNFLLNHYYSHRGIHNNDDKNPENSILAFQMAVEKGYGIELDIQVTKDKIPVIFHDKSLLRVCNLENKIQTLTLEELKKLKLFKSDQYLPTFKEILDLVDGRVPLIVEIKNETTDISELKYIASLLDTYTGIYAIESFNPLVLRWYKKNRPHIIRGQLATCSKKKDLSVCKKVKDFILENFMTNFLSKPDFLAFNYKYKNMFSFNLCKILYNPITAAYTIKSHQTLKDNLDDFNIFIFDSFIPEEDTKRF